MSQARRRLVLQIVGTDSSFQRQEIRGEIAWVGQCLHCNRKLVVALDGSTAATIEHCVPQNHGGTDDLENLALACAPCNRQKGYRHDWKSPDDPRDKEVIEALVAKRRSRWRPGPGGA